MGPGLPGQVLLEHLYSFAENKHFWKGVVMYWIYFPRQVEEHELVHWIHHTSTLWITTYCRAGGHFCVDKLMIFFSKIYIFLNYSQVVLLFTKKARTVCYASVKNASHNIHVFVSLRYCIKISSIWNNIALSFPFKLNTNLLSSWIRLLYINFEKLFIYKCTWVLFFL